MRYYVSVAKIIYPRKNQEKYRAFILNNWDRCGQSQSDIVQNKISALTIFPASSSGQLGRAGGTRRDVCGSQDSSKILRLFIQVFCRGLQSSSGHTGPGPADICPWSRQHLYLGPGVRADMLAIFDNVPL